MTESNGSGRSAAVSRIASYLAMLVFSAGAFLVVRHFGLGLAAHPPEPATGLFGEPGSVRDAHTLMHVLLALAVVIVTARAVGALFAFLNQPAVVGEVLAGIFLGPSVLGRFAPGAANYLLPASVAPFLGVLSQVGVVIYMFLVGLELSPAGVAERRTAGPRRRPARAIDYFPSCAVRPSTCISKYSFLL